MTAAAADTPENRRRAWSNLWVLATAQALVGSQMSMVFITAGLAGAMIAPNPCLATLPVSMTMLGSMGMDPSVLEHVYVAGGIGSGINMKNAVTIGMLPDISLDHFSYIGNSSLSGAYAMLISDASREKVDELARSMTYLELSTEPGYMDAFIAACFLPHTDAQLFPSVGL